MNRISVIWFEDRHNKDQWKAFKRLARDNGIDLYAYEDMESGVKAVQDNPDKYDVILLDANFQENQQNKIVEQKYSLQTWKTITKTISKEFDFFVYTGEQKTINDQTFNEYFEYDKKERRIFYKGDDEEIERLFTALKNSAVNQPIMELKSKYKEEYLAYSNSNLGLERDDLFLKVAKFLSEQDADISKSDLRMIVEDILESFIRIGLLSENVYKSKGHLTGSIYFIRGEHNYYKFNSKYKTRLHYSIAPALELLIKSCGADSHKSSDTNYFSKRTLAEVLFQTLSALAKMYNQIKNIEENKKTWKPNYKVGKIENRKHGLVFVHSGGEEALEDHLKKPYYPHDKTFMKIDEYRDYRKTKIEELLIK